MFVEQNCKSEIQENRWLPRADGRPTNGAESRDTSRPELDNAWPITSTLNSHSSFITSDAG